MDEITYDWNIQPLVDSRGTPVVMKLGDGSKNKPLKCEWSTLKGALGLRLGLGVRIRARGRVRVRG